MMTVKINLYFLLGFTRTTSSELIRWYDEICPRRLVSSIRETFTEPFRSKEISFTHSHTQIYRDIPDFHGIVKKKLCVVHVIAVGFCICRNEKRNSYLRPIAPVFLAVLAWCFFFFYIWPEYCYMHEILYFPLCVLSDENWVNIYTVLGRSVRKGNFGTLWMIYVKIIISNL